MIGQKTNILNLQSFNHPYQFNTLWAENDFHFQYQEIINLLTRLFPQFYLNSFYIRRHYGKLQFQIEILSLYKGKIPKNDNQNLPSVQNLATCLQIYTRASQIKIKIEVNALPKTLISSESRKVFKKFRNEFFFWQSLNLATALIEGKAKACVLVTFLDQCIRRNRKRQRFLPYMKKVLLWHYHKSHNIQGLRIEIKGRLKRKSRTRKWIARIGSVSRQTFAIPVDYAIGESFTVFGTIGIKVWICPYVESTKKNKI